MIGPLAVILESTVQQHCPQAEIDELRENSEEIGAALRELGYRTEIIPFTLDVAAVRSTLTTLEPQVAFNLVDSIEGKGNLISLAPMLLAHMSIPFTGATALATATSCDKLVTKQLLRAGALRTPGWFSERQIDGGTEITSPYILKSVTEHASFGIFADSVTNSGETLNVRWQEKKARYGGEWFAEEYIEGREFNLSLLGNGDGARVLPCAEIIFTDEFPQDRPRIVDYAAKWYADSAECRGTVRSFDFTAADKALLAALQQSALACWELFDLTGYARVDFRVDEQGTPYVLEVNSNPFLTSQEGFGSAAARAGIGFTHLIERIVADAYRRSARPAPAMSAA